LLLPHGPSQPNVPFNVSSGQPRPPVPLKAELSACSACHRRCSDAKAGRLVFSFEQTSMTLTVLTMRDRRLYAAKVDQCQRPLTICPACAFSSPAAILMARYHPQ
jgi:predicted molibdopterin-dependent oxidoreductase YjgC